MVSMVKKKVAKKPEPKRGYKRDKPVSLHPLSLEDALGALLQTPPEPDDADGEKAPEKPAQDA